MDLVTVTGYKTVRDLMNPDTGMDNFEWQCWLQYWKENLFGPFANNYMLAQVSGCSAHAFGGGSWSPKKYMAQMLPEQTEPEEITEQQTQAMTFNILAAFAGNEYAAKWKGAPKNASN